MIIDFFGDKREYIGKINELLKDDNYVLWIEDFMKENSYFTNQAQSQLYRNVSLQDLDNMANLNYFYDILASFAKDIGFSPYNYEGYDYYLFKYNGVGYKVMCSNKMLFLCYKIELYDYEYFFDYSEIKKNILIKRYN